MNPREPEYDILNINRLYHVYIQSNTNKDNEKRKHTAISQEHIQHTAFIQQHT